MMGKENELIEEMLNYRIQIMGLSETKKKRSGEMCMDKGYTLRFSGSPRSNRAKEGVGIVVSNEIERKVIGWEAISSRIMTISLQLQETVGLYKYIHRQRIL